LQAAGKPRVLDFRAESGLVGVAPALDLKAQARCGPSNGPARRLLPGPVSLRSIPRSIPALGTALASIRARGSRQGLGHVKSGCRPAPIQLTQREERSLSSLVRPPREERQPDLQDRHRWEQGQRARRQPERSSTSPFNSVGSRYVGQLSRTDGAPRRAFGRRTLRSG